MLSGRVQNCQKIKGAHSTARCTFFCEVRSLGGSSYVHAGTMPRARDQLGALVGHVEGLVTLSFLGRSCNHILATIHKMPRFVVPRVNCSSNIICAPNIRHSKHGPRAYRLETTRRYCFSKSLQAFALRFLLSGRKGIGWACVERWAGQSRGERSRNGSRTRLNLGHQVRNTPTKKLRAGPLQTIWNIAHVDKSKYIIQWITWSSDGCEVALFLFRLRPLQQTQNYTSNQQIVDKCTWYKGCMFVEVPTLYVIDELYSSVASCLEHGLEGYSPSSCPCPGLPHAWKQRDAQHLLTLRR